MSRLPSGLGISPSHPALTLLVGLALLSDVRADSPHGTDAPTTPGSSADGDAASSADNAAGASGSHAGLSKTAQIVIGVVIGVVGIAAIAFGVWFFLRKKRKWDEQAKRYETINAYRKSMKARRQHEMSLRTQRRNRRPDTDLEHGNLEVSEPELPKYDPLTFHRQETSIDSARGLSIDLARQSVVDSQLYQQQLHQHQRNSLHVSGIPPPPPRGPAPAAVNATRGSTSMEMTTPLSTNVSRGVSPTEGLDHSNTDSPTPMLQEARSGFMGTFRGPKKPKPVLTRLITNL